MASAIDKSIEHILSSATDTGFYYRTGSGGKRDTSMRAVGVLCLHLFGQGESAAAQMLGDLTAEHDLKLLAWTSDKKGDARFVMYWMYYATQVMFQRGGREWKVWNKKFQSLLMKNQHPDGYWLTPAIQGFETHCCGMSDVDNKIYSTTLSALQLTVYYRYLPSSVVKKSTTAIQVSHEAPGKDQGEEVIDIF